MALKELTLDQLFDTNGNMLPECCQRRGKRATPGPHAFLSGQNIPDAERTGHLDTLNNGGWRIDDTDDSYYCPFCVAAMPS